MGGDIQGRGLVRFDRVGLSYDGATDVLSDISFELEPGSFHFLTGASGAGKTSLLRLMYLAMKPTRGSITVFGQNPAEMRRHRLADLRRHMGVVFQDFRLIGHLSVFDNVALPLRVAGAAEADVHRHVLELLGWVGLKNRADIMPSQLSGGQQQLVAVARAVISRPRLLIADEPTGSVDQRAARRLMYLFEELNRIGATVLVATHNEALVAGTRHPHLRLQHGYLRQEAVPSPRSPAGSDEGGGGATTLAAARETPRAPMPAGPPSHPPTARRSSPGAERDSATETADPAHGPRSVSGVACS